MNQQEIENYLLAYSNMKIIQRKDMFNFSLDTVLLSNFCTMSKNTERIIDFGTNNAAIPLLLSVRTRASIVGIEIQKEAVELAKRNVLLNHLENQILIKEANIKTYRDDKFQLVVCNPPFFKVNEQSHVNENQYLKIARHEIEIDLEGIIQHAARLLDNRGRLALIHRPDRLIEIISLMREYDIEPKRLRFIYPKVHRDCHMVLIEGMYKGNSGLKIEAPLYAHDEDGSYSQEVRKMFGE